MAEKTNERENSEHSDSEHSNTEHSESSKSSESSDIDWDEYCMGLALLSAQEKHYNKCQVGACISKNRKKIISTGHNGCHAEHHAIMKSKSNDFKDCTMYVTLFPCIKCAKMIIQKGIKHIIYLHDNENTTKQNKNKVLDMFAKADIKISQYNLERET